MSTTADARRLEQAEGLAAATLRALSGDLALNIRRHRVHRGRRALALGAPHLNLAVPVDGQSEPLRGPADAAALRVAFSDAALHRRLAPADPLERTLFELFEQLRVEAIVPEHWPGVRDNVERGFTAWSLAFHAAGHTASASGLLLYTALQMLRARLTGHEAIEPDEGLLEATRFALAPLLGPALAGMRRERFEQARYAVHALAAAASVAALLRAGSGDAAARPGGFANGDDDGDEAGDDATAFHFWVVDTEPAPEGEGAGSGGAAPRHAADGQAEPYRIFTTAYDREAAATTLVRAERLHELRQQLDRAVDASRIAVAPLARAWQALFEQPRSDGWESPLEEGRIDARRLARLVTSPAERALFRDERVAPRADALVTLLIDCSGSMKSRAEAVAVLADLTARALERAGIACEVLGYTTGAWSGGRAQRDWQRAGRPASPGRLNERLHIVFKAATAPWRRARAALAALLAGELFREGLDGEAVQWAAARVQSWTGDGLGQGSGHAPPQRLILLVCDGAPMDSATLLVNGRGFLDAHLQQALAEIERRGGGIGGGIGGLGVGLELSPFLRQRQLLDLDGGATRAAASDMLALAARVLRRR